MFEKTLTAIAAALLLASCTASTTSPTTTTTDTAAQTAIAGSLSEADQPDENIDADADVSAIAVLPGTDRTTKLPLLAIEVEITADNVKPVGVKIVHSLPIANSAHDDLRVKIDGAREFEYTIADPLVAMVQDENGPRAITLESARTHVFTPLLPAIRTLSIEPVPGTEAPRTRGGVIDVRPLAEEACRRTQLQLPVCQQILGQR